MKSYKEIKQEAKSKLTGNWLEYILILIVGTILYEIAIVIGMILVIVPGVIIACLYSYSIYNLSLSTLDGEKPDFQMLYQYNGKVWRIVGAVLLIALIIVVPVSISAIIMVLTNGNAFGIILLIIVYLFAIYFGVRTQYTLYIIRDTDLSATEALNQSLNITKGHFLYIFFFYLSFIGWILLSALTLGLLLFWLYPYMQVSDANLYRHLYHKDNNEGSRINIIEEM